MSSIARLNQLKEKAIRKFRKMATMPKSRKSTSITNDPWRNALYDLRAAMNWEQQDAADQIPVSRTTWARWESGSRQLDNVTKYALRALIAKHVPKILKNLDK